MYTYRTLITVYYLTLVLRFNDSMIESTRQDIRMISYNIAYCVCAPTMLRLIEPLNCVDCSRIDSGDMVHDNADALHEFINKGPCLSSTMSMQWIIHIQGYVYRCRFRQQTHYTGNFVHSGYVCSMLKSQYWVKIIRYLHWWQIDCSKIRVVCLRHCSIRSCIYTNTGVCSISILIH